jgi:hypothetical protein
MGARPRERASPGCSQLVAGPDRLPRCARAVAPALCGTTGRAIGPALHARPARRRRRDVFATRPQACVRCPHREARGTQNVIKSSSAGGSGCRRPRGGFDTSKPPVRPLDRRELQRIKGTRSHGPGGVAQCDASMQWKARGLEKKSGGFAGKKAARRSMLRLAGDYRTVLTTRPVRLAAASPDTIGPIRDEASESTPRGVQHPYSA